jgi:hypothetical protein
MNHDTWSEMLSIISDYSNKYNWDDDKWVGPGNGPEIAKKFMNKLMKDLESEMLSAKMAYSNKAIQLELFER